MSSFVRTQWGSSPSTPAGSGTGGAPGGTGAGAERGAVAVGTVVSGQVEPAQERTSHGGSEVVAESCSGSLLSWQGLLLALPTLLLSWVEEGSWGGQQVRCGSS